MNITRKGTADHVWHLDPAIDYEAAGCVEAYKHALRTGDVSGIPIREGCKPTVWKLQRLPRRVFLRVDGAKGMAADQELVALGLVGVDNLTVDDVPVVIRTEKVDGVDRVTAECLDRIYDPGLFNELGAHVVILSKLDPSSGQGS
jgi:hypothetical protein